MLRCACGSAVCVAGQAGTAGAQVLLVRSIAACGMGPAHGTWVHGATWHGSAHLRPLLPRDDEEGVHKVEDLGNVEEPEQGRQRRLLVVEGVAGRDAAPPPFSRCHNDSINTGRKRGYSLVARLGGARLATSELTEERHEAVGRSEAHVTGALREAHLAIPTLPTSSLLNLLSLQRLSSRPSPPRSSQLPPHLHA